MKARLWSIVAVVMLLSPAPSTALAQDDEKTYDARLAGHSENVVLDSGGTATTYLLLAALGVLCAGVLFKSAHRSHLD
ncbi:MAG: hypothetical protein RMJ35_12865 [Phycisphaerales bacterium]|nr:hypothetical protein [Phycisphaerales bacterium]